MNNVLILFILFAVVVLVVAALAIAIGYFWASSKAKSALLSQITEQSDAIRKEAQEQLQTWKEQELAVIRQQTYDAAKGQAIQEMQEQVKFWQDNELQKIRQQIFDAAKGQAAQDAQEQLVKWRNEELEAAKTEIREVLNKEATLNLEQWKVEVEKQIRQDAISKSQSVTMGKMTEHIVPYLPGFEFNPSDARFIGSPIDLIVFDGLDEECLKKIVFIEIKTGNSTLSTRERWVRDAILAKNIEWRQVRVNLESPDVVHEVRSRRAMNV